MPLPKSDNIKVTTYADDITLTTPGPNNDTLADNMNPYINSLNTWLPVTNLSLSKDKSTTSIFSTWTEWLTQLTCPLVATPKFLE